MRLDDGAWHVPGAVVVDGHKTMPVESCNSLHIVCGKW